MDYTIKQNDNLSTIAKNNNTDVATLQKLNNIKNPDLIQTGGTLKLPTVSNPVISTSNVINSQALAPVPTVNIPTPAPVVTPVVPQIPVNNIASEYLKSQDLTQNEKSAQTGQDSIVTKMLENIAGLSGESAYRTEKLNNSNLNTLKQDLQSINSQILTKQAEINKSDVELIANMRAEERRDTLLPFAQMGQAKLSGDAQILRALKTSEIGVLNALALGRQGDISLAKETIQEAVDSRYAPYREQNAIYKAQLEAIQPLLTSAEKKQATAQQFKLNQAIKEIDKVSDFQKTILSNAISSNAPQSVINAISKGQSIEEITKAGQGYLQSAADKLDLQLKQRTLANLGLTGQKIQQEIKSSGVTNLSPENSKVVANIDPVGYFSSVIKENKIKGSTSLEALLGVIGASKNLADYGIEKGKFRGAAPIGLTPGVFRGEQQLTVRGNINAINLKVQQWASGAALTTQQTEQVKRFTPDTNDTDKQIRTKLNNLTNFMMEQGKSSLATQGVNIEIPKIDLFNQPIVETTEDIYVDQLLNNPANSPFNVFEN